jgi:hypothetical protein
VLVPAAGVKSITERSRLPLRVRELSEARVGLLAVGVLNTKARDLVIKQVQSLDPEDQQDARGRALEDAVRASSFGRRALALGLFFAVVGCGARGVRAPAGATPAPAPLVDPARRPGRAPHPGGDAGLGPPSARSAARSSARSRAPSTWSPPSSMAGPPAPASARRSTTSSRPAWC